VVTDIVFLRKRDRGEPARQVDPDWLGVAPLEIDGGEVPVNRYFLNHPEMVLGNWTTKDTLYGGEGYSVTSNGNLPDQLKQAVDRLPEFAPIQASKADYRKAPAFVPPPLERHISEGSFFVGDGRSIYQIEGGQGMPVVYGGTQLKADGTMTGKRLAALIELRDRARRVLQSQNEGWPDEHREEARRELNRVYDRFTDAYGPINKTTFGETADGTTIRRMPNLVKFKEDPDAMLVMSLEDYDETTGRATKAAIMSRDVVGKTPPVTKVRSAEEGLLVSLNQHGAVYLDYIAKLYDKPEAQIIEELGDLIYKDTESGKWETADAYLSGNVREKLAIAERAGPEFARNANALRSVQPEDVLPGDIDANFRRSVDSRIRHPSVRGRPVQGRSRHGARGPSEEGRGLEPRGRLRCPAVRCGNIRLRYCPSQRHLVVGTGPQHEIADHLRHHPERRPRRASRQPGRHNGRPRKAEADQGEIPLMGVCRS
jgi:hypothetical protein